MAQTCIVESANGHPDFPLNNLPYGIFSPQALDDPTPRVGVAIGDQVLDLSLVATSGLFEGVGDYDTNMWVTVFSASALNEFMALGKPVWQAVRAHLTALLTVGNENASAVESALVPMETVAMMLPAKIGDYTDFYASREHASNIGTMFRGKDNALQPNWLHLPVGYHGRASSVVVSGTPIRRPCGQIMVDKTDPSKGPMYSPCKGMDFELEMGIFVGGAPTELGEPVTMAEVEDHIFGLVLMNDWSARDIQKWEYVPLGPFGSKNFGTTISPWVVTLDALEPFRCETSAGAQDDPVPQAYIQDPNYDSYNIDLTVAIQPEGKNSGAVVCHSNFRNLYWNIKQMIVHHTVTGCNLNPGDLMGSGTISGSEQGSFGSCVELSWGGKNPFTLTFPGAAEAEAEAEAAEPVERRFLVDGDNVIMAGRCSLENGTKLGFGTCEGVVLPAKPQC